MKKVFVILAIVVALALSSSAQYVTYPGWSSGWIEDTFGVSCAPNNCYNAWTGTYYVSTIGGSHAGFPYQATASSTYPDLKMYYGYNTVSNTKILLPGTVFPVTGNYRVEVETIAYPVGSEKPWITLGISDFSAYPAINYPTGVYCSPCGADQYLNIPLTNSSGSEFMTFQANNVNSGQHWVTVAFGDPCVANPTLMGCGPQQKYNTNIAFMVGQVIIYQVNEFTSWCNEITVNGGVLSSSKSVSSDMDTATTNCRNSVGVNYHWVSVGGPETQPGGPGTTVYCNSPCRLLDIT